MANEKRLIDANALKDSFCNACSTNKRYQRTNDECRSHKDSYGNSCFKMRLIDSAPTVDAVEVVHGSWIELPSMAPEYKCSECGQSYEWWEVSEAHYCPNCGAKMDGDGNGS